jgi:hypothetical protein
MNDDLWLLESPVSLLEGEAVAFSVEWLGAGQVAAPAAWAYKDGEDITDEVMAGDDEHTVRGRVMTLKRLAPRPGDGGQRYLLLVQAEVDGNVQRRKCVVEVGRAERET